MEETLKQRTTGFSRQELFQIKVWHQNTLLIFPLFRANISGLIQVTHVEITGQLSVEYGSFLWILYSNMLFKAKLRVQMFIKWTQRRWRWRGTEGKDL